MKSKFPGLKNHWTFSRGKMIPKKQFQSEDEAYLFIEENKMKGYHPYLCRDCGMWHIGHRLKKTS